ncbi:MAG: alpha-N-arabinofuranosidase [Gemmatimonadetes bacterium]|nr:alpha-N-arabinofuranosidase [Gemmatimonadota bacterium]
MIFGQFIEHFHRQIYGGLFEPGSPLADAKGFRKDVIAALKELGVPVVRWPGGCFVSGYHWRNGVGEPRTPAYDKAWKVEDPNTFGTDEFVSWCRLIGAEPYICTNAGSGTPEEMSDWVEYCNLAAEGQWAKLRQKSGFTEPHNVRYWSIGNENYGDWEIGAKTVEEWGYFVRESAKMMRFVDPSIKLFAAATTDRNWTLPLLERAGRYLDYISIHGYWDPLWQENNLSNYLECMRRSVQPERQIQDAIVLLEETKLAERVKIAFDEWNLRGWHHPGHPLRKSDELLAARAKNDLNDTYTMADACFSGCFLNACIRHAEHVHMANMAPVVNARGPLFVHPGGIVRRTTFHTLALYHQQLETNAVAAAVTSDPIPDTNPVVPALDASVTRSQAGRTVALAIVNRHPESAVSCRLGLRGLRGGARLSMTVLAGDSPDACNDVGRPDRVVPETSRPVAFGGTVDLPPHSVSVLRLQV